MRRHHVLEVVSLVACAVALSEPALAIEFQGVIGAEPLDIRAPKDCYVYPRYVVVSQETSDYQLVVTVKKRGDKSDEEMNALCRPDGSGVLLQRTYDPGDSFYGIARDVLLIRQEGSGGVNPMLLERLSSPSRKRLNITSSRLERPRVIGSELQLLLDIESKDPSCPADLDLSDLGWRECMARAHAQWACIKAGAGKRLAAAADPFDAIDVSRLESGKDCQLEVYEVVRVDLKTLEIRPTGQVKASVHFMAAN